MRCLKIVSFLFLFVLVLSCREAGPKTFLFVGSFTKGLPDTGIYVYDFDTKTGQVNLVDEVDSIINPSFLSISPNGKYLYAVTESQLQRNGSLSAFAIDSVSGKIMFLNKQDAGGRNPVHISIDASNSILINSNYTDPSISVFECNADGSLQPYSQLIKFRDSSVVKGRQDGAHIHSTNFSPDGNYLFAHDLGADKIRAFTVDRPAQSIVTLRTDLNIKTKAGSGPRHFTFHPNGKYGYGIEELSGTISQYYYAEGSLDFMNDYLSYSKKQEIYRAADIHISPDGKFLYASNRGPEENSISIFSIDAVNGNLTLVGREPTYGDHPRNFVIEPSGAFLLVANQFSNTVVVFKRDKKSGLLTQVATEIKIDDPSSLQMRSYQ